MHSDATTKTHYTRRPRQKAKQLATMAEQTKEQDAPAVTEAATVSHEDAVHLAVRPAEVQVEHNELDPAC